MLLLSTLLLVASPTCNATSGPPRVAFIGNSILYYNDVPRLLETISAPGLTHDCCLRGGASLTSLLADGNGMRRIFGTENGKLEDGTFDTGAPTVDELLVGDASPSWDYVVLHDFTQGPARPETRHESARSLKDTYGPLLARTDAMPVFLATHAYRVHNRGSEDLGAIPHEFTEKLSEGYKAYADALTAALPERREVRIAPFGHAMAIVHDEKPKLWESLFNPDNFHLSPGGSLLEAAVLHQTIFGEPAPNALNRDDVSTLFANARVMQPPNEPPLPFPTREEAAYLVEVAERVMRDKPRGYMRFLQRERSDFEVHDEV